MTTDVDENKLRPSVVYKSTTAFLNDRSETIEWFLKTDTTIVIECDDKEHHLVIGQFQRNSVRFGYYVNSETPNNLVCLGQFVYDLIGYKSLASTVKEVAKNPEAYIAISQGRIGDARALTCVNSKHVSSFFYWMYLTSVIHKC